MIALHKLFQLASLLLVLSAGFCLSVDLVQAVSHDQKSTQAESCPDNGSVPDCFCCCAHVLPVPHQPSIAIMQCKFIEPAYRESLVFLPRAPLVRPPRA